MPVLAREMDFGVVVKILNDFDDLFSTTTGYDALDKRIALTKDKKEALLLALKFPFLPLHNNDAENGAQHQARLRDIHLQTKTFCKSKSFIYSYRLYSIYQSILIHLHC